MPLLRPCSRLPTPCRHETPSSASLADESRQLLHISMQTAAMQEVRDEEEPPAVLNTLATRKLHSLEGCTSLLRVGAKLRASTRRAQGAPSQGRAPWQGRRAAPPGCPGRRAARPGPRRPPRRRLRPQPHAAAGLPGCSHPGRPVPRPHRGPPGEAARPPCCTPTRRPALRKRAPPPPAVAAGPRRSNPADQPVPQAHRLGPRRRLAGPLRFQAAGHAQAPCTAAALGCAAAAGARPALPSGLATAAWFSQAASSPDSAGACTSWPAAASARAGLLPEHAPKGLHNGRECR